METGFTAGILVVRQAGWQSGRQSLKFQKLVNQNIRFSALFRQSTALMHFKCFFRPNTTTRLFYRV